MVLSHVLGETSEFQRQEPISLAMTQDFKERNNRIKQEGFFFIEDEKGPESILLIPLLIIFDFMH